MKRFIISLLISYFKSVNKKETYKDLVLARMASWLFKSSIAACLWWNISTNTIFAQGNYTETLSPYIRNFTSNEYNDLPQNWSITQDKRGFIYVANQGAVLEYDGVHWRSILTAQNTPVRSVTADKNGRVYVGAVGEIGYLAPNAQGKMRFMSLTEQIPEADREFGDVWGAFAAGETIYFHTASKIFRITPDKKVTIWRAKTEEKDFHYAFYVRNKFYVRTRGVGLQELQGDSLRIAPGGERFSEERVYVMAAYGEKDILIGTRAQGFFIYDGKTFKSLPTEADAYLSEYTLYQGIRLPNGNYALATLSGGVVIMDPKGRVLQVVNTKTGLQVDGVNGLLAESDGSLWTALANGIARVEVSSPLTYRSDLTGQKTYVQQIIRHKGVLYIATPGSGVFFQRPSERLNPYQRPVYESVPALTNLQCWWFLSFDDKLLVATSEGLYQIEQASAALVSEPHVVLCVTRGKKYPNRIYLGLQSGGLQTMRYENGGWINEGRLEGVTEEIRRITEDKNGGLWLGTTHEGLIYVKFGSAFSLKPNLTRFSKKDGLLDIYDNSSFETRKGLLFGNSEGVLRFNEKNKSFQLDTALGKNKQGAFYISEGDDDRLWLIRYVEAGGYHKVDAFYPEQSGYKKSVSPFARIEKSTLTYLYAEKDGVLWLSGSEGLARLDTRIPKDYSRRFPVWVRRVTVNQDSILFDGAFADENGYVTAKQTLIPRLAPRLNAFRFECASSSYDASDRNKYQYFLEGFDEGWSPWTDESRKDYTNLPNGFYRFYVRSQNVYGVTSLEAIYAFQIAPPWYKTWWAFLLFIGSGVGGIYGVIQWRLSRLRAENVLLERKVEERTAEVMEQKAQLEVAYGEIQVQNDNLQSANDEIQRQQSSLQSAYEEITAQKDNLQSAYKEIEHKNEDIMDSIKYARRIQESILPDGDFIHTTLPDSFVLYKPRDIVSGDFYWFSVKNGISIIAAIDCTGHGVPGAFMSVMANSLLNQVVNERGITVADDILNVLNYNVKVTLHQLDPNSTSNDGMDIALCAMDFEKGTFSFAGANRPLFLFRNGELEEIKGTKFPIGGRLYHEEQVFHRTDFEIVPGQSFYICSDGYIDQFGGPRKKKFMTGQFKELLNKIHSWPMEEQSAELDRVIEEWKGDTPQLDDILVIGVRF